jgi:hypothetical protein
MDYRENPEDVADFLDELEEGERVYVEADMAEMEEEDPTPALKRGDEVLDDHGTVIETGEYGVRIELDETRVQSSEDPEEWATNVFRLTGEQVFAEWKYIGDEKSELGDEESELDKRPADLQIAMLNRIEQIED